MRLDSIEKMKHSALPAMIHALLVWMEQREDVSPVTYQEFCKPMLQESVHVLNPVRMDFIEILPALISNASRAIIHVHNAQDPTLRFVRHVRLDIISMALKEQTLELAMKWEFVQNISLEIRLMNAMNATTLA